MMNIQTILDAYSIEDKRKIALQAERMAYIRGDTELAKAYGMIADLLSGRNREDD